MSNVVDRDHLAELLGADHNTERGAVDGAIADLVHAGWIDEVPDPERGLHESRSGRYVLRKQDELLKLPSLSQLATAVLGYVAGLHLWPYALGAGFIQLAFIWARVREERAFVSVDEARVIRALLEHRRDGRTVSELVADVNMDPIPGEGDLGAVDVETILGRLLKLPKQDGEPIAVVRRDDDKWFPVKI